MTNFVTELRFGKGGEGKGLESALIHPIDMGKSEPISTLKTWKMKKVNFQT